MKMVNPRLTFKKEAIIFPLLADCWYTSPMESFFKTLKTELVHHRRFKSRAEAKLEIFEYTEVFYNRFRLHSALGYETPEEFKKNYDNLKKVA
ncbi:Integrase core domain protein [Neomoorella glycerini]|uniref:Integrase core domain protein n=1 Tax=Neomoorella glycerini TaxID=55779 RepID=A0A6I5ZTP7_9FIRM|nr:Integrase core domain protein [Moorella glycerini]